MEAGAVGESGVDHRRRPIQAQSQRSDDPLDDAHDREVVQRQRDLLEPPGALDEAPSGPVDHHFGHGRIREQGLERSETRDFVRQLAHEPLVPVRREQWVGLVQQCAQPPSELGRGDADELFDGFGTHESLMHRAAQRPVRVRRRGANRTHATAPR